MISRTLASISPRQSLSSLILASSTAGADFTGTVSFTRNSNLALHLAPRFQSGTEARRPVAYGSTNKYRPVKNCKARGMTANSPREFVYLFSATATTLMTTAAVKAIDNQRWVCRIHLFQFNLASSQPSSRITPRLTVRFYGAKSDGIREIL